MEKAAAMEKNIEIVPLEVKYPQGSEKHLIKAILNRDVPPGKLPMDVRTIVQNVSTALAIKEAVVDGKPLVERRITVTGRLIEEPKNIRVRIGTLFEDVINACGGLLETPRKVIMGGPMMGIAQKGLDVPVIKTTCGILVLGKDEIDETAPRSCIRCGRCMDVCPMKLLPNMLGLLSERRRWQEISTYYLFDCIECGCCAYICPAKRPLVHYIKLAKYYVSKEKDK
jgi:electron transport complex protein RnfC